MTPICDPNTSPKCGCCNEINAAIAKHYYMVDRVFNAPKLKRLPDYQLEEAQSDAIEALWRALTAFDGRMNCEAYIYTKVYQRVVDGLRIRGIDHRHSDKTNRLKKNLLFTESIHNPGYENSLVEKPLMLEPTNDKRIPMIYDLCGHIDKSLAHHNAALRADHVPSLRAMLDQFATGSRDAREVAEDLDCDIQIVKKKVAALRSYVRLYPDLIWREGLKYSTTNTWKVSLPKDPIIKEDPINNLEGAIL